jgi:hypothetical protein
MRAQRMWRVNETESAGQLQSKLDGLNKRISQLERQHPSNWTVDALKSSALTISREIDDMRCAEAMTSLRELLRR